MTWAERFTAAGVLSLVSAVFLTFVSVAFDVSAARIVVALVVLWVPLLAIAFTVIALALAGRAIDRAGQAPGSAHAASVGGAVQFGQPAYHPGARR